MQNKHADIHISSWNKMFALIEELLVSVLMLDFYI